MTTTPGCIRAQMLQRAARLMSGTHNEEAWHVTSLFQQSHPAAFLEICHRILASFLELTYDYFDNGWPVKSRLQARSTRPLSASRLRRRQGRSATVSMFFGDAPIFDDEINSKMTELSTILSNPRIRSPAQSLGGLLSGPSQLFTNSPGAAKQSGMDRHNFNKLKTMTAKRLFKQLLPSRPRTPIRGLRVSCFETTPSQSSVFSHIDTPIVRPVTPLNSTTCNRSPCVTRSASNSRNSQTGWASDNLDVMVCHCLIGYMLQNPVVCSVEGLFRIPGNSQRIRDLWFQLRDYYLTPYIRLSQPEPDNSAFSHPRRLDVYDILDGYSAHDVATLLLRCLVNSVQPGDSSKQFSLQMTSDELSSSTATSAGLIHPQISDLFFLSTRLQYVLGGQTTTSLSNDWVHILCHARQLLTYRIVLQFLIPMPERSILLGLLQVFHQVALASKTSLMPAECIARCTAVAIFGSPSATTTPKQLSSSDPCENPLRWRIDTLTNLIRMADQLDELPGLIYAAVRGRLRAHFGNSPIPRLPLTLTRMDDPLLDQENSLDSADWSHKYHGLLLPPPTNKLIVNESFIRTDRPPTSTPTITPTQYRASTLQRAKSTLESAHTLTLSNRMFITGSHSREPFKCWRRQKLITSQSSQKFPMRNRLTKVQSTSVIELNRTLESVENRLR